MANGYKKIASGGRPGKLAMARLSLWRGPDHLLQIERDHYTETYRRFYFNDIEILAVRLDNRRRNIAITFGIIVGAFLGLALYLNGGASGFFFGVAGFFMIPFIYNLVRGPTCVTHVTTAVQREELESVRRVKGAMRLLNIIREGAAQTQGVLAPDMVRVKFELQKAPPPLPGVPPAAAPMPGVEMAPEMTPPIAPPETPPPAQ